MPSLKIALLYSIVSRFSLKIIGLISTIVIARLMTPDEVGTFAIASALVLISSEFKQLGAGLYLIREEHLNSEKIKSALGLTMLMSWSLGILIIGTSFLVADFYDIPDLQIIFNILALSFFISPHISIMTALHERAFNFDILFKANLLPKILGLAITTILILKEFSYFSLAIGQSVTIALQFIIMLYYRPSEMRWFPAFKNLSEITKFGIFNTFSSLFRKSLLTTPDLIIGKLGATSQVGIFSRGLGFVDFIHKTITAGVFPVVMPYLSELKRAKKDINQAYLLSTSLMIAMIWPVMAVCAVAAYPAIIFLFGDQWGDAAPIASMLFLWGIIRSAHIFSPNVMIIAHLEKVMFYKDGLILLLFIIFFISLFDKTNLLSACYAYIITAFIDLIMITSILKIKLGLSVTEYLFSTLKNIALTASCGLTAVILDIYVDFTNSPPYLPLLALASLLPPVWFISLILLKHPLYLEIKTHFKGKKRAP